MSNIEKSNSFEADGRQFLTGKIENFDDEPGNLLAKAFCKNKCVFMKTIDNNDCYSYDISSNDFNFDKLEKIPVVKASNKVSKNLGNILYEICTFLSDITEDVINDDLGFKYGNISSFTDISKEFGVIYYNDKCIFSTREIRVVRITERIIPDVYTVEYIEILRAKLDAENSGMSMTPMHPDDIRFLSTVDTINTYNFTKAAKKEDSWIADAFSLMLLYTTPEENGLLFSQFISKSFLSKNYFKKYETMKPIITAFVTSIGLHINSNTSNEKSFVYQIAKNFLSNVSPSKATLTEAFFTTLLESIKYIDINFANISCEYNNKIVSGSEIYSETNVISYLFGEEKTAKENVVAAKKNIKKEDLSHLSYEEQKEIKKQNLQRKKEDKQIKKYEEEAGMYSNYEDKF